MNARVKKILEAKDLGLYKILLRMFNEYTVKTPASGYSQLLDSLIENGAKALPSDSVALDTIRSVTCADSTASGIHRLLNLRFADLPGDIRPMIRPKRKLIVANWNTGDKVSDRVKDLIDWDGTGKKGFWSDIDGNKAEIINMTHEELPAQSA